MSETHITRLLLILSLMCVVGSSSEAREYKKALPGYTLKFPADQASHGDYKTEWWYYTGHLLGNDGTKYGYELTFFRSAIDVPRPVKKSAWSIDNVYLAHFAVSDLSKNRFFHTQRLNRPSLNMAGADEKTLSVWNGDWKVALASDGTQKLYAKTPEYTLELALKSPKPPVLHGSNGLSQKANCVGCASYYYSFTRMDATGSIVRNGSNPIPVTGTTWMDHEFGSNQLTAEQVGWDWFALMLDDKTELMLYVMRQKNGKLDPNSSGTFVTVDGGTKHLALADYQFEKTATWRSPHTNSEYPMGWKISVPLLKLDLRVEPEMKDQELVKQRDSDVTYWEGTCAVTGNKDGKPIKGQAYVEMTGYAETFNKSI